MRLFNDSRQLFVMALQKHIRNLILIFYSVVEPIIFLAYAIGFSVATGPLGILAILAIVAFFGLAWSGISLALGLRTRSAESVFGIAGFLTFPPLFMSTSLVPQSAMPAWMQSVSS